MVTATPNAVFFLRAVSYSSFPVPSFSFCPTKHRARAVDVKNQKQS